MSKKSKVKPSTDLGKDKAEEWSKYMADKINRARTKGHPHWLSSNTSVEALVLHIYAELQELFSARTNEERLREAADVANVAFMLAERLKDNEEEVRRAQLAVRLARQAHAP